MPEVGEYIVGAYLKIIEKCDVIDYNARPPGGGLEGLNELDVIGLNFSTKTAFLCEVTTHIIGLLIKDAYSTVATIKRKHENQRKYAETFLTLFEHHRFMFWSPVVNHSAVINELALIQQDKSLEVVINSEYKLRIEQLRAQARKLTHDTNNPFFRTLQILERLSDK